MSAVLRFSLDLSYTECYNCGVVFAMPQSLGQRLQRDGGYFYCPNGHSQHYTEPEVVRLRKQIEKEQSRTEFERRQREEAERQMVSLRGQLTKTKNRLAKGVCPVCKRNFVALGKHIQGQHPSYCEEPSK